MDAKKELVKRIMDQIAKENAEEHSRVIDGEVKWHKLFVIDMARIEHQLEQLPFHELQDQAEAGRFSFCDN